MMTTRKMYDISPALTPRTAVFDCDTPLSREVLLDTTRGDRITLSTLRSTVHLGAHADGPNHYGVGGRAIDAQALDLYVGPCQVIDVRGRGGERIGLEDIVGEIAQPRVLFRTDSFPDPERFNSDFRALSVELVHWLAEKGVRLVGIDTPSVDTAASKDLPAHQAIFEHDIAILEGLVLTDVPAGSYELIALPLKLVGFDGSPVRAVLRAL